MMRNLYLIGLYAALCSPAVTALTYVVDPSCGTALDPIIDEVKKMARIANEKLAKNDEVVVAALDHLFKTKDSGFLTSISPTYL